MTNKFGKPLSGDDFKDTEEVCSKDCPWSCEGSYGVDMGCLPHASDFVKQAENGKILSCHSDYSVPCTGIKDFLENRGVDISTLELIPNEG